MKEKTLKLVDSTLRWGADVAEMWSGTQFEKQIDLKQAQVIKSVEKEDWSGANKLVSSLVELLTYAEEEYARG